MNNQAQNEFGWTSFYTAFANKLLMYRRNRQALLDILALAYKVLDMKYPFDYHGEILDDIDPFTIYGSFNKGITDDNRIKIMSEIAKRIGVSVSPPASFAGIPVVNNMRSWFIRSNVDRAAGDVDLLWDLFEVAVALADNPSEGTVSDFIVKYDRVTKLPLIKWNITMGLYWIRPFFFINLDDKNRTTLLNDNLPFSQDVKKITTLKAPPNAKAYLALTNLFHEKFKNNDYPVASFPELSQAAWDASVNEKVSANKLNDECTDSVILPIDAVLNYLGGMKKTHKLLTRAKLYELNDGSKVLLRGSRLLSGYRYFYGLQKAIVDSSENIDYLVLIKGSEGIYRIPYNLIKGLCLDGSISFADKGKSANEAVMGYRINCELNKESNRFELKLIGGKPAVEIDEYYYKVTSDTTHSTGIHYWIYSPGEQARLWDEFYQGGIMGIGWDDLGDLRLYPDREAMREKLKELYDKTKKYQNDSLATWQFANELNEGDIVFAKRGLYEVVGRGVVESDYVFDETRNEYKNIRNVKWTHKGSWQHPGQAVMKTLTDITPYTEYVQKLELLTLGEDEAEELLPDIDIEYDEYSDIDFLSEVFMDDSQYGAIVGLLRKKKNIILQGAPGVGKTFAAKRLAYSLLGEKDTSRVMMIQFHQSYSYEDFIMGFRPAKDGFELKEGPFYAFCKRAQDDLERDYFFIIDEINRGNLSKIFGELLMLIESDKRGKELRLLYSDERFSVPKNLYIIGLMNTADRSLALIDYVLRRRFAFYEMEPAFDSEGFQMMCSDFGSERLNNLIDCIKELNEHIRKDDSLGDGFRIGHSYLCMKEVVSDTWIESVVLYEILPILREYWFDDKSKVDEWTKNLLGVLDD